MAEAPTLINLANLNNQTTAVNAINSNSSAIATAFEDVLSLSGTAPNQMRSSLDMNSHPILNMTSLDMNNNEITGLPEAMAAGEPVTFEVFNAALIGAGNVPVGGLTGQSLTKRTNASFDYDWENPSASGVAFTQAGTGAVTRTVQNKERDFVSALDFGVTGDGVTDDTANIIKADIYAASVGKSLYFPGGNYVISSTITPTAGAHWIGASIEQTSLYMASTTNTAFNITNNSVEMEHFRVLPQTTRTSSAITFNVSGATDVYIHDVDTIFNGISYKLDNGITGIFDRVNTKSTVANGIDVWVTGSFLTTFSNFVFSGDVNNPPAQHFLLNNLEQLQILNGSMFQALEGIRISPGSGQAVSQLKVDTTYTDSNPHGSLNIVPTGTGTVTRVSYVNGWLAGATSGYSIITLTGGGSTTLSQIYLDNNEVVSANSFATVFTATNAVQVTFTNNRVISNATGPVLKIDGTVGCEIISNAMFGAAASTVGISLLNSTDKCLINNNDLSAFTTTPISNTSSGAQNSILDNLGYKPMGELASGQVWIGQATNTALQAKTLSGDATLVAAGTLTLASTITAAGPIGSATATPVITYDAKGRLTTVTSSTVTPAIGSITGLGTGIATALTTNTGSAGAPVLFNGAGGTPTSMTATNLTGTASGLTAGSVTTNANLTGDVTSVGNATTLTNAPVIAKVLTGYTSGAGTISATDSILTAIQKLNGNDATNANLTGVITSSGNATSIASQTGTGTKFVVDTSPTLVTPNLGTPSAVILTNATGTASSLTAGNVTTNANLTGDVTSVGNATTLTNAPVIAKVLTGYVSGAGTVSATDSILAAIQKLNGNDATNANLTGDVTSVGNATTLTNAPVIAKVLTGYTSGAGTVAATDSILAAIQKLNGNDATNANLTGVITSSGNATSIASQTGTGTKFVVDTSPTMSGATFTGTTTTGAINASAVFASTDTTSGTSTTAASITAKSLGLTENLNVGGVTAVQAITAFGLVSFTAGSRLLSGTGQAWLRPDNTLGWTAGYSANDTLFKWSDSTSTVVITFDSGGNISSSGSIKSTSTSAGIGYATGAGGTVSQATGRTTGVTLNKTSGAITLFSQINSAVSAVTAQSFTVTNSSVAATDTISVNQKSGTDLYEIFVTNVAAGSFKITNYSTGGTTNEAPVFTFNVIKGVTS